MSRNGGGDQVGPGELDFRLRAMAGAAGDAASNLTSAEVIGAARHRRARRMQAAGAVLVAAAIVAVFVAPIPQLHLFRHGTTPPAGTAASTTTHPVTTVPVVGDRWQPITMQWLSGTTAYVLETEPCGTRTCTRLLLTTDGGLRFRAEPAATVNGRPTFANLHDAYRISGAEGDTEGSFFQSDNAGRSWQAVDFGKGTTVLNFTVADGQVYVAVNRCTPTYVCTDYRLYRSAAGSSSWASAPIPTVDLHGSGIGIGAFGSRVWLTLGNGGPVTLLESTDGGVSFSVASSDIEALSCGPFPTSSSVLWLSCSTGNYGHWSRSSDGGASFVGLNVAGPNGAGLDVVSDSVAFFTSPSDPTVFERTTNSGATFQQLKAPNMSGAAGLQVYFGDPTHGLAVVTNGNGTGPTSLWRTSDGGLTWVRATT
jgi:hypothetical protein